VISSSGAIRTGVSRMMQVAECTNHESSTVQSLCVSRAFQPKLGSWRFVLVLVFRFKQRPSTSPGHCPIFQSDQAGSSIRLAIEFRPMHRGCALEPVRNIRARGGRPSWLPGTLARYPYAKHPQTVFPMGPEQSRCSHPLSVGLRRQYVLAASAMSLGFCLSSC
jgi:hypothetical protein